MNPAEKKTLTDKIHLEEPIARGETSLDVLQLRKPKGGELRGLSMFDLMKLDVIAVQTLLPRITIPPITEHEARELSTEDTLTLSAEIANFFLSKATKADSPAA